MFSVKQWRWRFLSLLAIFSLFPLFPSVAEADSCTTLEPVGGESLTVTKTVVQPTIPLPVPGVSVNNNWNTDFAIAGTQQHDKYVVTLTPKDTGEYAIRMYLKYSNNTSDQFYDEQLVLTANEPLVVTGTPRNYQSPYQVNVFVGDPVSMGKTYTVAVQGCQLR